MFVLQCACGGEIYGNESDPREAWQCEECGKWYDLFGCEVRSPLEEAPPALFKDYDPNFTDEEDG